MCSRRKRETQYPWVQRIDACMRICRTRRFTIAVVSRGAEWGSSQWRKSGLGSPVLPALLSASSFLHSWRLLAFILASLCPEMRWQRDIILSCNLAQRGTSNVLSFTLAIRPTHRLNLPARELRNTFPSHSRIAAAPPPVRTRMRAQPPQRAIFATPS